MVSQYHSLCFCVWGKVHEEIVNDLVHHSFFLLWISFLLSGNVVSKIFLYIHNTLHYTFYSSPASLYIYTIVSTLTYIYICTHYIYTHPCFIYLVYSFIASSMLLLAESHKARTHTYWRVIVWLLTEDREH